MSKGFGQKSSGTAPLYRETPAFEVLCMHFCNYMYATHISMSIAALHHGHHQHLEGVAQWLLLQTPLQHLAVLHQFDTPLPGKRCRPHAGKTSHDGKFIGRQWLLQEVKSKEEYTIWVTLKSTDCSQDTTEETRHTQKVFNELQDSSKSNPMTYYKRILPTMYILPLHYDRKEQPFFYQLQLSSHIIDHHVRHIYTSLHVHVQVYVIGFDKNGQLGAKKIIIMVICTKILLSKGSWTKLVK